MKAALNWNRELTKQNQRAFFEVPETQKPQQIKSATARCLVESLKLRRFDDRLIHSSIG